MINNIKCQKVKIAILRHNKHHRINNSTTNFQIKIDKQLQTIKVITCHKFLIICHIKVWTYNHKGNHKPQLSLIINQVFFQLKHNLLLIINQVSYPLKNCLYRFQQLFLLTLKLYCHISLILRILQAKFKCQTIQRYQIICLKLQIFHH